MKEWRVTFRATLEVRVEAPTEPTAVREAREKVGEYWWPVLPTNVLLESVEEEMSE